MRVNIQESIYRDHRFHKLSAEFGIAGALGRCVLAWDLAHRFYLRSPHRTIPLAEWNKYSELGDILRVGLAEMTTSGVYVKGANDECAYLEARSTAGRAGGLKTQENISSKLKQNQPSSSSSSSNSSSNSKKTKKKKTCFIMPMGMEHALLSVGKEFAQHLNPESVTLWLNHYEPAILAKAMNECANYYVTKKGFKAATTQLTNWLDKPWNKTKYPKKTDGLGKYDSQVEFESSPDPFDLMLSKKGKGNG